MGPNPAACAHWKPCRELTSVRGCCIPAAASLAVHIDPPRRHSKFDQCFLHVGVLIRYGMSSTSGNLRLYKKQLDLGQSYSLWCSSRHGSHRYKLREYWAQVGFVTISRWRKDFAPTATFGHSGSFDPLCEFPPRYFDGSVSQSQFSSEAEEMIRLGIPTVK